MSDSLGNILEIGMHGRDALLDQHHKNEPNLHAARPHVDDPKAYYDFLELLGEGAFCKVYKAIYHPTGETIAVKVSHKYLNHY